MDLVLQAHVHNYQRSYPIKYDSSIPTESIEVTDNQKNTYDDPEGQIYLIVGTAGAKPHDVIGDQCNENNQNHDDGYMICGYKGFGFLNVDLTSNGETLNAKFFANEDDAIIDQFTIAKKFQ